MAKEKKDRWDMASALACLKRNGIKTTKNGGITADGAGIKVQGAIDYLVNYREFHRK